MPEPPYRAIVLAYLPDRFSASDTPRRLTNCTEGWAYAVGGKYHGRPVPTLDQMREYDLVLANLDPSLLADYVPLQEKRPANQRWVSLIEGCGADYFHPSKLLLSVMDGSDLISGINRHSISYLRRITRAPVEWIGVPHPSEEIAALGTAWEDRANEALVCPTKNFYPSLLVANALGLTVTRYLPKVSRKLKSLKIYMKHRDFRRDVLLRQWESEPSSVPRIARMENDLPDFWRQAGRCRIWINLDPRYTWGRYVLDAAALGVPIIATRSTDHAPVLFPETTVESPFDVEEAIRIGKRLIADEAWAKKVAAYAKANLHTFSAEECAKRLYAALDAVVNPAEPRQVR